MLQGLTAHPNEPSPGPRSTFAPSRIVNELEVGRVRQVLARCTPFAQAIFVGTCKPPTADRPSRRKRKRKGRPWRPRAASTSPFGATHPTTALAADETAQCACIRSHERAVVGRALEHRRASLSTCHLHSSARTSENLLSCVLARSIEMAGSW